MSFDYTPEEEFPCIENRSLGQQCASMSDGELSHQLKKEWDNKAVTEALICEALSRLLIKTVKGVGA